MNLPTIDDIEISHTVNVATNKTIIKIYPKIGFSFHPPLTSDFLKQFIQRPLDKWCSDFLSSNYNLVYRYNDGDPYWSLFIDNTSDFNIFMLRFGANKH